VQKNGSSKKERSVGPENQKKKNRTRTGAGENFEGSVQGGVKVTQEKKPAKRMLKSDYTGEYNQKGGKNLHCPEI